jgi:predicted transcriptional regulator
MAQSLLEIMELREIIKLRLLKFRNRRISQELGIHRNIVNKYVQLLQVSGFDDQELLELDDSSLRDLFPSYYAIDTNRYEKLSKNFSFYASVLKKTGCTKLRLWEDYTLQNPDG